MAKSSYDVQKEWRDQVVQRLDNLDVGHKEVSGVCQDIRLQLHRLLEIDGLKTSTNELDKRVRTVENDHILLKESDRSRKAWVVAGGTAIIGLIIRTVWEIISHYKP